MFKKLQNLIVLALMIIIVSGDTYAQNNSGNPFMSYDKIYEERLIIAKDKIDNIHKSQKNLSAEELKSQENYFQNQFGNRYIIKFNEEASMEDIFEIVNLYNFDIIANSDNRLFILEIEDFENFIKQSTDIIEFVEKDIQKKRKCKDFQLKWRRISSKHI